MRILKICFKNINSLVGSWEIDFEAPAYREQGLFAITGPTGSGKTTVLDALCLGLYGQTPRLSARGASPGKEGNELMSLQKGDCRAEVTFEVPRGRYRIFWEQHRAGSRREGKLQNPRRELAEARTGTVLATKSRDVDALVLELTGMGFPQFTRSVLLAQGGFASFLRAGTDEKAPLLEQITGTEIYSRISRRVHEEHALKKRELAEHRALLEELPLCSPEEEARFRKELAEAREKQLRGERRKEELGQAVAWHREVLRLEEQQHRMEERLEILARREREERENLGRLARGERAERLEGDLKALDKERREVLRKREEQEALRRELEELSRTLETNLRSLKKAEVHVAALEEEREALLPDLDSMEESDRILARLQERCGEEEAKEKALREEREESARKWESVRNSRNGLERLLKEERRYMEAYPRDGELGEVLGGWRERWHRMASLEKECAGLKKELEELGLREADRKNALEDQGALCKEKERALEELLSRKTVLEDREKETLEGESPEIREERCRSLEAEERWFVPFISLQKECRRLGKERRSGAESLEEERKCQRNLEAELERAKEREVHREREYLLCRENHDLAKQVERLEEMRRNLERGKPCPLCGSMEHPWRQGPPERLVSREEGLLEEAEHARNEVRKELAALEQKLAERSRTLEKEEERLEKLIAQEEEKGAEREALLQDYPGDKNISREILKDPEGRFQQIETLLEKEKQWQNAWNALQKERGVLDKELLSLGEAIRENRHGMATLELECQNLKERRTALDRGLSSKEQEAGALRNALRESVLPWVSAPEESRSMEDLLNGLDLRRKRWLEKRAGEEHTKEQLETLSREEETLGALLEKEQKLLASQEDAVRERREDLESRQNHRRECWGSRNPREERRNLEERQSAGSAELQELRSTHAALEARARDREVQEKNLQGELQRRREELEKEETSFSSRMEVLGFGCEEELRKSLLAPEEREALLTLRDDLEEQRASLRGALGENEGELQRVRGFPRTLRTLEELEEERHSLEEERTAAHEAEVLLELRLKEQEELRERARELQLREEILCRSFESWDLLNRLIGSSEGKKFRNFAQELTFAQVLGAANRELRKMSPRYVLRGGGPGDKALELKVEDLYQAGEIRSSRNLSGGESFLVSLALALGLSRMMGGSRRVDSLFLDEGFGSLDEDTLETALNALMELGEECRLIGLISHVPALRERLDNRICLIPQPGGRSLLQGPGVRECSSRR